MDIEAGMAEIRECEDQRQEYAALRLEGKCHRAALRESRRANEVRGRARDMQMRAPARMRGAQRFLSADAPVSADVPNLYGAPGLKLLWSDSRTPEEWACLERRVEAVRAVCTPNQWDTLVKRFGLEGDPMSTREIAAERGCTHQSVEKAISFARRKALAA